MTKQRRLLSDDGLEQVLRRDELTVEDVRIALATVRHGFKADELLAYARSLVPDADLLDGSALRALARADITEDEASKEIQKNRAFCARLAGLLPSILRLFDSRNNLAGIFRMIDDCYNDFHVTAVSRRKDRQTREIKEGLADAIKFSLKAAEAIENAKLVGTEYQSFCEVYFLDGKNQPRYLDDLVEQLRMYSGVAEIVDSLIDLNPPGPFRTLYLSGNDARTTVVEYAYHMCTMWNGPRLVTTPGSQFADLCSFLFEAISGQADEGLSGAINRYARSDERKQWDREGQEEVSEDDNFLGLKGRMRFAQENLRLYTAMARRSTLSEMAKTLVALRLQDEANQYEEAKNTYGPNQVYLSQMNSEQIATMFTDAIESWRPDKQKDFADFLESKKASLDALEIKLGESRRAARDATS
ncbi:hypothetical protein [Bradyrhizobium liaoningense]